LIFIFVLIIETGSSNANFEIITMFLEKHYPRVLPNLHETQRNSTRGFGEVKIKFNISDTAEEVRGKIYE